VTRYCPDCGDSHECTAEADREEGKTRIRLAEIERDRDVRIAELRAGEVKTEAAAAVDIAAAEAETDAARAEGEAAGMAEVLEAAAGPPPAEPADAEPVIVDVPPAEPPADGTPAPPETVPPARSEKKSPGFWDMYR
jgi:hypothetical protein